MKRLCLGHCALLCCFLGLVKQEETLEIPNKRRGKGDLCLSVAFPTLDAIESVEA